MLFRSHQIAEVTAVEPAAFVERVLTPALERAALRARAEGVRRHLAPADRVLIMMQDDPDPDAIASALALRVLLGRGRTGATIATFGEIRRPENRAMARILDIDVEEISARAEELVAHNAQFLKPEGDLALVLFATPGPVGYYLGEEGGAGSGPDRKSVV